MFVYFYHMIGLITYYRMLIIMIITDEILVRRISILAFIYGRITNRCNHRDIIQR